MVLLPVPEGIKDSDEVRKDIGHNGKWYLHVRVIDAFIRYGS